MRQLVYQICYTRYYASFYLWLIGSALKHCKVPKYYEQDCSFVINFQRIFKWLFRPTKILLLRHSQNKNSFKRDLAKRIYITLGVYEFLNIHIFNWYKALYSASSSSFWHLDFIRAVRWLRAASPMVYS